MTGEVHISSIHREKQETVDEWEIIGEGGKIVGKVKHTHTQEVLITDMSDGSFRVVPGGVK